MKQPSPEVLNLNKIGFSYQNHPVLKNISFQLNAAESLGIIGPNGGGKSTLLKIIVGLLTPTQGEIKFRQQSLSKKGSHGYPPGELAYVPQFSTLNQLMPLRVTDLLELGLLHQRTSRGHHQIDEILTLVGLLEKKNSLISSLSGGEKQRALIAKSLIHHPTLLILDEPLTGVDSTGQDQIFKILDSLKKNYHTSIIIVEHNLNRVIQHCDQLICLNKTHHWHDHKKMLTKKVLESIYHCEFEHLLIHETGGEDIDHHHCPHEDHEHEHNLEEKR